MVDDLHISPLSLPHIEPPGKTWLDPVPQPLGEWKAWESGGIKGWTLKLHPVFEIQVRYQRHPDHYWFNINNLDIHGHRPTLEEAQWAAEEYVVAMLRQMLPAYRVMHARVADRKAPPGQGCTGFTGKKSWQGRAK